VGIEDEAPIYRLFGPKEVCALRERTVNVDSGQWTHVPFATDLLEITAGGLGPCLGVLVYNHDNKDTVAGHFSSPLVHQAEDFDAMLSAAAEAFAQSSRLSIFVGGCCEDNVIDGKKALKVRASVEKKIATWAVAHWAKGIAILVTKWPRHDEEGTNLSILPDSGLVDTK